MLTKQTVVQDAVSGQFLVVDGDGKTLSTHATIEEAQKAAGLHPLKDAPKDDPKDEPSTGGSQAPRRAGRD